LIQKPPEGALTQHQQDPKAQIPHFTAHCTKLKRLGMDVL